MKANKQNIEHLAVDLDSIFPGMMFKRRYCLAEDILEDMGFEIDTSMEVQHAV